MTPAEKQRILKALEARVKAMERRVLRPRTHEEVLEMYNVTVDAKMRERVFQAYGVEY